MAEVILETPFAEIHGAIEKHGIISRQKKYRDDSGKVIHEGKQEAYAVRNPRDFKKNPPKGNELAHHNRFREACAQTTAILQNPAERAKWEKRFLAQLPNKRGKHPDPVAPIDPHTRKPKRYLQLPAFIRAMIYQDLKAQNQELTSL